MFRCCGAQSIAKLRENPNRCGFAGYRMKLGKRLGQAFVIRRRVQNGVIRYIIADDLNGRGEMQNADLTPAATLGRKSTQNANAMHAVSLNPPSFQETP